MKSYSKLFYFALIWTARFVFFIYFHIIKLTASLFFHLKSLIGWKIREILNCLFFFRKHGVSNLKKPINCFNYKSISKTAGHLISKVSQKLYTTANAISKYIWSRCGNFSFTCTASHISSSNSWEAQRDKF